MKAPNFTSETASEMGKRGVIARKAKREREKQLLEAARLIQPPEGDEARKQRVQRQIDILLADMEKSKSVDVRLRISAALERLWKLVSPTAGVLRPKRGSGSTERPSVQPVG